MFETQLCYEDDKEDDEADEHSEDLHDEPAVGADAVEVLEQVRLRVVHVGHRAGPPAPPLASPRPSPQHFLTSQLNFCRPAPLPLCTHLPTAVTLSSHIPSLKVVVLKVS